MHRLNDQMIDFAQAPLTVTWEATRSCALACVHCRVGADLAPRPEELSASEAKRLIDDIHEMGSASMVFSGGDPLYRPDFLELVRHGRSVGLRLGAVLPASLNLTRENLRALRAAGLDRVAFSLDGATAPSHDAFRRVPGAFARVVAAAGWARELGLSLQINTGFGAWNWTEFDAMADLVSGLGVACWEVFFQIPVGRGPKLGGLSREQFEQAFVRLDALVREKPFIVRLAEGQHFRRFGIPSSGSKLPARAVNAGDGLLFVDHRGDICPSVHLPLSRGNVRLDGLAEVYRDDSMFRHLRDRSLLKGKCGACEYRQVCGGSRSRAWATTGDAWAEDPACAYLPKAAALS